jgi:prepilin-type N-terminal cleavage/methylation domain-containing protein
MLKSNGKKVMLSMKIRFSQKGFTLVELLIVIGILAVLLAIVLVAVNPQKQFKQANNTARKADVNAILNAISAYAADNKGQLPAGITGTALEINSSGAAGSVDLCATLVPNYIADLPLDPDSAAGTESPAGSVCSDASAEYDTGYTVKASNNRVTVAAPSAEDGEVIGVTR